MSSVIYVVLETEWPPHFRFSDDSWLKVLDLGDLCRARAPQEVRAGDREQGYGTVSWQVVWECTLWIHPLRVTRLAFLTAAQARVGAGTAPPLAGRRRGIPAAIPAGRRRIMFTGTQKHLKMTKSERIKRLASDQDHLAEQDVEAAVKALLDRMRDALARGERIEIRGFGRFSLHDRPPRLARHPNTGETIQTSGKSVPPFKPAKELRERVNSLTKPESEGFQIGNPLSSFFIR